MSSSAFLFILFFAISKSQIDFWTEPMDTALLPTDWTSTGPKPWSFIETGGAASCPGGAAYCWDFSGDSSIATTASSITTSEHTSIQLSYNVRIRRRGGAAGSCIVEYSTDGTTNYIPLSTYTADVDTTETYSVFTPSADQNTNGISLRIRTEATNKNLDCYFNDFALNGVFTSSATTSAPSSAPNTGAPTSAPNTGAPSSAPNTAAPSSAPNTVAPTSTPNTAAPSSAPNTAAPTTNVPTSSPNTATPSSAPNTAAPTSAPNTAAPTTNVPTSAPNTAAPSSAPNTAAPTTKTPSSSPNTAIPSASPNTVSPSVATTYSGTAVVYFNDIYTSIALPGNTPRDSATNIYNPAQGVPFIAMPFNLCTRDSDDPDYARVIKWQCSASNGLASRCQYGDEDECGTSTCLYDSDTVTAWYTRESGTSFAYGECNGGGLSSTTQNYMEIKYYGAYSESNKGCPATPYNATAYRGFYFYSTSRFATGVCVAQHNGQYILSKCNSDGEGDISIYNDASCSGLVSTIASYNGICQKLDLTYDDGAPRFFRRFAGCYVNGINIVRSTDPPTSEPTVNPVSTLNPSEYPTSTPTTPIPTSTPSSSPTIEPTTTEAPTQTPTRHPTKTPTFRPSQAPIDYTSSPTPSPTRSPTSQGMRFVNEVKTMTLVQYVITALVIIYIFIGCGIWCIERAKRFAILNPSDNERKRQFAEAKSRKLKEVQMQGMSRGRQAVNSVSLVQNNEGVEGR